MGIDIVPRSAYIFQWLLPERGGMETVYIRDRTKRVGARICRMPMARSARAAAMCAMPAV